MIKLFRAFFPSWRFFDGVVSSPELYYRVSQNGESFGDWILCIPKTKKRSFKNLFVNSRESFLFASHALLEYLKDDLEGEVDPTTSLELVQNLVRFRISEEGLEWKKFQFEVAYSSDLAAPLYLSPALEKLTS